MRRMSPVILLLLVIAGVMLVLDVRAEQSVHSQVAGNQSSTRTMSLGRRAQVHISQQSPAAYVYSTLKLSARFVLARAPKGSNGQPLGAFQPVANFGDQFGLSESDSVLSMQLSPDGRYLAINASRDHGEQVWIFDTQQGKLSLLPANVLGNFLNWMPGGNGHTFLYRPMFPLGPNAPMTSTGWNPGLWEVDAATGAFKNIDIHMPSAFLVDAAASPNGSRIIYSTTAGLGMESDTWLMNSDGSNLTHLFTIPGGSQSIAAMFAWSPDGKSIAYELLSDSSTPFLPASLWVMSSNGTQQRYLAGADGGHGYRLAWSPDGSKIAFVERTNVTNRQADLQAQALQCAIAVVDVATARSWIVASPNQTGMQLNYNPSWAANSASITFIASNPVNLVIGGSPRYWSARVTTAPAQPSVQALTPVMQHVVAVG